MSASPSLPTVSPAAPPPKHNDRKRERAEMLQEFGSEMEAKYRGQLGKFAKKKRQMFSSEEKSIFADIVADCDGNISKAKQVLLMFYPSMHRATLRNLKQSRRRGKPVNVTFERAVLSKVLYQTISKMTQQKDITGNILHSIYMLKHAAEQTKAEEAFRSCAIVNKLKFSNCWCLGLLRRNKLTKRAITCKPTSDMPSPQEIRQTQRRIQKTLEGHAPDDVISADETGINWKASEKVVWCPAGSDRPPGAGDDKVRITAHLAGNGPGKMLPAMTILKCECKDDAQQGRTTKLENLLRVFNSKEPGNWTLHNWTRELDFGKGRKSYFRKYLINRSGDVITLQNNAWMDSAGCVFWLDHVVVPWAQANGRRPVIVWDNFHPHLSCMEVIRSGQVTLPVEIKFEVLPPRCTRVLQVMDLVVNATLKAAMRRLRLGRLFVDFQNWRHDYAVAVSNDKPVFEPPQISECDGVLDLLKAASVAFSSPTFQSGMTRAFVKVGLLPLPHATGTLYQLYPHEHPSSYGKWVEGLPSTEFTPDDNRFCVDELFDELALISFESADEQRQLEAAFWSSDVADHNTGSDEFDDADSDSDDDL